MPGSNRNEASPREDTSRGGLQQIEVSFREEPQGRGTERSNAPVHDGDGGPLLPDGVAIVSWPDIPIQPGGSGQFGAAVYGPGPTEITWSVSGSGSEFCTLVIIDPTTVEVQVAIGASPGVPYTPTLRVESFYDAGIFATRDFTIDWST
jgi:hypothetical protein